MKEERMIHLGSILLKYIEDVAFARFLLLQKLDESKIVCGIDNNGYCGTFGDVKLGYGIGIVMQEEDVKDVEKVIEILDHYEIENKAYMSN